MMQRIREWTCYWMTRTRKYRHAWRVSAFIIGVVISNSLVEYAVVGNVMTFLVGDFQFALVLAAAIINIKEGLTSLMAIMGSIISDAYVSRYFVVLVSVALYMDGLLLFTLSVRNGNILLLYPALVLIAMGEGGQEHTLRKFGTDQFEEHIKDKHKAKPHSTAWWYTGSIIGSVAGMVLVSFSSYIYVVDADIRSWKQWANLGMYSIMFILVAFLVLVLGTLSYYRNVPCGSPFTHMFHVVVAVAKKRRLNWPADDSIIHDGRNPGGIASDASSTINMSDDRKDYNINGTMDKHDVDGSRRDNHTNGLQSGNSKENCCLENDEIKGGLADDESLRPCSDCIDHTGGNDACLLPPHENYSVSLEDGSPAPNYANDETHCLPHTNCPRCLHKATIITQPEANEESKRRLCTQTEVEETKLFLRLFPIWATFLMYGMVLSMGKTFFIAQANTLNTKLSNRFRIPVTFLLAIAGFSKLVVTKACLPLLNRLTRLDHGITPKVRIGAGLFLSALCCLTSTLVEKKRLKAVAFDYPEWSLISIFWLIPQFWVLGAMEGLVGNGIEDLFISQVPETMWKCGPAFSESVQGMGSILSAITMLFHLNQVGGHRGWFAHGINKSRLDWYFAMLAGLSLINLFLYAIVSKEYHWPGTENQHKRETNRGTVKRSVACVEMLGGIITGRD